MIWVSFDDLGDGMSCPKALSFRVQILIEFDVHSFVLAVTADVVYDNSQRRFHYGHACCKDGRSAY